MTTTPSLTAPPKMRLRVNHRTEYLYPDPVRESANEIRLAPATTPWQRPLATFVTVLPAARLQGYTDLNGNRVQRFEIPQPHSRLVIESRIRVETARKIDFDHFPYGMPMDRLRAMDGLEECRPYLQSSTFVEVSPQVWREAAAVRGSSNDVFQTAYAIMEHIFTRYEYGSGFTGSTTHANEVVATRRGVCQDFAHAMVALCRSLGIPARYVSGYVFDNTRDQHLRGTEASHAWADIFIESQGWFGFDPTNNTLVDEKYIVIATGRDYSDAAPVSGTFFGTPGPPPNVSVTVARD